MGLHLFLSLILAFHLAFSGKGNTGGHISTGCMWNCTARTVQVWLFEKDKGTRRLGSPCPQAP